MFCTYLRAGYPLLYVRTIEVERAFSAFIEEINSDGLGHFNIFVWKPHTGLYKYRSYLRWDQRADTIDDALGVVLRDENISEETVDSIYVFFGIHHFLNKPSVLSALRDISSMLSTRGGHIVCFGPDADIPVELQDVITTLDFPLPGPSDFRKSFENLISEYKTAIGKDIGNDILERAIEASRGLSLMQAEGAAALSIVEKKPFESRFFNQEKQILLSQTVALRSLGNDGLKFDDLGGFDRLKEHVRLRKYYFDNTAEAIRFGILAPPKGIFIVGIPGTGKSLSAKCIATELGLPLYKFDVGALFRSYVGDSEANTRKTLKLVELLAPCVLLLDELEKMAAGMHGTGSTDSGVTSRVLATFLSWMQDSKAPVYRVATANTIRNLDAALIRRGRWDAVFSVDLPNFSERREIFRIHLKRRKLNPDDFDLDMLARLAQNFVGAEIESCIEESLFKAFSKNKRLTSEDLAVIIKSTVPISDTSREEIQQFRQWLKNRALPVSSEKGDSNG